MTLLAKKINKDFENKLYNKDCIVNVWRSLA